MMSDVTLDDLLTGLPEVYHPGVTAIWNHRQGVRDLDELNGALDGLLRHARAVLSGPPNDRDHPKNWRLNHPAWASAAWDEAEMCPRDEYGNISWSHRGQFWLHFSAGNIAHAGGLVILIIQDTTEELAMS